MKAMITGPLLAMVLVSSAWSERSANSTEERWIATSTTALSITGDIWLSPTRLRMAGHEFPLRLVANLQDFEADFGARVPARVSAITQPMNPRLLNGNTFGCGRPIRWIVVWQPDGGNSLAMDTFSGDHVPTSVRDAGSCGSYFYQRP